MTIEQVKAEAKKRFDRDLTDEQARAFLEADPAGELSEEELNQVTGGYMSPAAPTQAELKLKLKRCVKS